MIQPDLFWMKRPLLQYFGEICFLCLPEHGIAKLMLDLLFFSFPERKLWFRFGKCFGFVCVLSNTIYPRHVLVGMKDLMCQNAGCWMSCISFLLHVHKLVGNLLKSLQLCHFNAMKGETVSSWDTNKFKVFTKLELQVGSFPLKQPKL